MAAWEILSYGEKPFKVSKKISIAVHSKTHLKFKIVDSRYTRGPIKFVFLSGVHINRNYNFELYNAICCNSNIVIFISY